MAGDTVDIWGAGRVVTSEASVRPPTYGTCQCGPGRWAELGGLPNCGPQPEKHLLTGVQRAFAKGKQRMLGGSLKSAPEFN